MECYSARFASGDEVRVIRNIRNDGSFTQIDKGELLIEAGALGIVRSYGYFLQDQIIFQVFFPSINRVIGLRDNEVIDAELAWIPCHFHSLDKATLTLSLSIQQQIIARKGDQVEVQRSYRNLVDGSLDYEIAVGEHHVKVAAHVLSVCV
jgi:nitrogen fixation protein NifZ